MNDPEELEMFVEAQDTVWSSVVAELTQGSKTSHWMWFVFPQIAGLGRSPTAVLYAIADLDEARAYLAHPVLGPRLRQATDLVLQHQDTPAQEIFGGIDTTKFRSSMTLFQAADPSEPRFAQALDSFYDGPDPHTLEILRDTPQ